MFEKIQDAPKVGKVYALLKGKYIFEEYSEKVIDEIRSMVDELLELHIFDENREYRIVRSNRGDIETIVDDSYSYDDKYVEKVFVIDSVSKNGPDQADDFVDDGRISVVNYLKYDDDGMIKFVNYRFSTDLGL